MSKKYCKHCGSTKFESQIVDEYEQTYNEVCFCCKKIYISYKAILFHLLLGIVLSMLSFYFIYLALTLEPVFVLCSIFMLALGVCNILLSIFKLKINKGKKDE